MLLLSVMTTKLTKNLKRDAIIDNYDTVINNYDENVNLKCSSGFYLEVANPALLALALLPLLSHKDATINRTTPVSLLIAMISL